MLFSATSTTEIESETLFVTFNYGKPISLWGSCRVVTYKN